MHNISIIVAMAKNRAIGLNNKLLWHLPNDLKHFKATTMHKPIIMGRKTFESIGRPLPGRQNLVLTSNESWLQTTEFSEHSDIKIFHHKRQVLEFIEQNKFPEVCIIGGGEIYKLFLEEANRLYVTIVDTEMEADVYFPELDQSWQKISKQINLKDNKHKFNYDFIELIKK